MNLEEIAPIIEQIIKESLEEKRYPFGFAKYRGVSNKVASGKLRNSVSVKAEQGPSGHEYLQVMIESYAKYVQSGRLGHGSPIKKGDKGVPIQSLLEWIKDRKLKGRDKQGRFITNKSFAFAIRNNIWKYGIKPSNFLDISIEKVLEDPRITELLEGAAVEELIDLIEGI